MTRVNIYIKNVFFGIHVGKQEDYVFLHLKRLSSSFVFYQIQICPEQIHEITIMYVHRMCTDSFYVNI